MPPHTCPAPHTTPAHGPNAGRHLLSLPVSDLKKKGGGAWDTAYIKWKESGVDDARDAIKARFKKGSGTANHPHHDSSGLIVSSRAKGIAGARSAVVSYDIYFDPDNWHFSKGGKIAGFRIGKGNATGGRHTEEGASFRIMWKTDADAISYCYWPVGLPQPGAKVAGLATGEIYHRDIFKGVLTPGTWHHVVMAVKLNTFKNGKPAGDGRCSLTIDGRVGALNNVNWAATPETTIESFDLAPFFGGPDPATVDSVFYVKNFNVYEWKD